MEEDKFHFISLILSSNQRWSPVEWNICLGDNSVFFCVAINISTIKVQSKKPLHQNLSENKRLKISLKPRGGEEKKVV